MQFKLLNRAIVIGWSFINTLSGAIFSVLLSLEVIRLCSKEMWGSMVEVLLWFGIASHILNFGNSNLLSREFSLMPKNMVFDWSKSLQARFWLYILACFILVFLPLNMTMKSFLLILLSANFLYRSYDAIILFRRQFSISVILETGGFLIISIYILIEKTNLTLSSLVGVYSIAEVCKAITIYLLFLPEIKIPSLNFNMHYMVIAFPFFLLEFTGLLQSKADLMCVTYFLSKDKIAQFQVYINFLLLVQSVAGFVLAPFVKNIYRMKSPSIKKLALNFLKFGTILAFIAIFFINFFIRYFYHFSMSPLILCWGVLFIIPVFYYVPIIYHIIKYNKQRTVVTLNIIAALIALILNGILIPNSPDGISGAIAASAITQWVLLFSYIIIQKKSIPDAILA